MLRRSRNCLDMRIALLSAAMACGLAAGPAPARPVKHAPAPAAIVSAEAMRVHRSLLTLDTHLDTPEFLHIPGWSIMDRHDARRDFSQVDVPRMRQGHLDGGFWAIYTPQGPLTPEAT